MFAMLIAATYVDNQKILKYPIDLISSMLTWCDHIYWFVSDEINQDECEKYVNNEKIKIVNINHKIIKPVDISIAQNKCVQWIKNNTKAEFIFYQQADLIMTPEGQQIASNWVKQHNDQLAISLSAAQNKLFVELFDNPNGGVLFHRNFNYNATEDGWFIDNTLSPYSYRTLLDPWNSPVLKQNMRPMMDLGYISSTAYINKLINHAKIWPDNWKYSLLQTYLKDKAQGIKETIIRIRNFEESKGKPIKVVENTGQYSWLITKANLLDEYNFLKSIIG